MSPAPDYVREAEDRATALRGAAVLPPDYIRLALEVYSAGKISDERLGNLLGLSADDARRRAADAGVTPREERSTSCWATPFVPDPV